MVRGIGIQMLDELPKFLEEYTVEIATLTIPKDSAREVAELLVANGIKAIWNFAHIDLNLVLPSDIIVENVHLSESLMRLSYNLTHAENKQKKCRGCCTCGCEKADRVQHYFAFGRSMMRRVVTTQQMKEADEYTIRKMGIPSLVLMERAALACVDVLKREFPLERVFGTVRNRK